MKKPFTAIASGLRQCFLGTLLLAYACIILAKDVAPQPTPVASLPPAVLKSLSGATPDFLVRMPDGSIAARDIARIRSRGELIVAILNKDTPPFVQEKDGELGGVDIDLVRKVAEALKVSLRFDRSATTYDEIVQQVSIGKADLGVSKLARTMRRAEYVLFSNSYMYLEHALLVNRLAFASLARDRPLKTVIKNFNGTIGVLAGSAFEEFAHINFKAAKIVPFKNWNEVVAAVKKGEVVAAYRDAVEIRGIIQRDPGLALTLRTVSFTDIGSTLSIMVGPRDPVLLSYVNEIIASRAEKLSVDILLSRLHK
jgi:ABC-type amino acid transport substrate-binding protein